MRVNLNLMFWKMTLCDCYSEILVIVYIFLQMGDDTMKIGRE